MNVNEDLHYTYAGDGSPARILTNEGRNPDFPVVSEDINGGLHTHAADGTSAAHKVWNLVQVPPFSKDDPVMVRTGKAAWVRRHYAHAGPNGHHCTYPKGLTSWTNIWPEFEVWDECRNPDEPGDAE